MQKPIVRKNTYYFPSYETARAFAREEFWPTDRIIRYGLGWAIQLGVSGNYVGPTSAGNRRHEQLTAEAKIR